MIIIYNNNSHYLKSHLSPFHLHIRVYQSFWSFQLVVTSGEGPDNRFNIVCFGSGQFLSGSNNNFISSNTVIVLVVNLFVFM